MSHSGIWSLRKELPAWARFFWGVVGVAAVLALWWFVTWGEPREDRILSPAVLPSPAETFAPEQLHELWFDRHLTLNTLSSLRRLLLGYGLAVVVGVPIGLLCGCFPWIKAIFTPHLVFGRNIPVAALIPLTFLIFGLGETYKIMFLFLACIAFVIADTANAIEDVSQRYVDTAYTLGVNRWQIIYKVLFPLALPNIFNSLRLLFGLAFGYIMLAEQVKDTSTIYAGIGDIINQSQKRNLKEPIILVLLLIPLLAVGVDRVLFFVQKQLFPYQYGGLGLLQKFWTWLMHLGEDIKHLFIRPIPIAEFDATRAAAALHPNSAKNLAPAAQSVTTKEVASTIPPRDPIQGGA
ncbi:MAG: ABC transporter permease subunit [Pirellulales bacterium]|nr:ABC transporter permease subunit [Pirellulales bacterium]